MRVKMFSRIGLVGSYKAEHHLELENEVNAWLEQNPAIKIVDIKQSACGGTGSRPQFFITVVYEPS
jgi:hypothetical protein